MLTVHDVAAYILEKQGRMTAMKLQKLVYYSQAWSLVWDGEPLFDSDIEAWAHGPVATELFPDHKGKYLLEPGHFAKGYPRKVRGAKKETIDAVLTTYGSMTAAQLSELTHAEDPWKQARGKLAAGASGRGVISEASMRKFYSWLSEPGNGVSTVEEVGFSVAWAH